LALFLLTTLGVATAKADGVDGSPIELRAVPEARRFCVEIAHREWPGNAWTLRLPEYLVVYSWSVDRHVRQTASRDTMDASITLAGTKTSHGRGEHRFVLTPHDGFIDILATITNADFRPWGRHALGLSCLTFNDAPAFFDSTMGRTYVYSDGDLTSILSMSQEYGRVEEFQHRSHLLREERPGRRHTGHAEAKAITVGASLIIRSSEDGMRHVAQAWDSAYSVAYNFAPILNCIHSNPLFGAIQPGETKAVRGRIYFFEGTLEELYRKFEKDFPERGYAAPAE
jgi:hypothetical protein